MSTDGSIWPDLVDTTRGDLSRRTYEVWVFMDEAWWRNTETGEMLRIPSAAMARYKTLKEKADDCLGIHGAG